MWVDRNVIKIMMRNGDLISQCIFNLKHNKSVDWQIATSVHVNTFWSKSNKQ